MPTTPHTKAPLTTFEATMIVEGSWELVDIAPDGDTYIEAAQLLIDTGLAWQLQGFFGRVCAALIAAGHCTPAAAH